MAQMLKDTIRNTIIQSAREEFLKNGFEAASMRRIAKGARMSVGNLYHYFHNKEDLFGSIVNSSIDRLNRLLKRNTNNLIDFEKSISNLNLNFQQMKSLKNTTLIMELTDLLQELLIENQIELILILKKSKGYKYGNSKEDLIEWIEGIVEKKVLFDNNKEYLNNTDKIYVKSLAKGFFESVCELVDHSSTNIDVKYILEKLMQFYFD